MGRFKRVRGKGVCSDSFKPLVSVIGSSWDRGEIVDGTMSITGAGATLIWLPPGSPKPADTDGDEPWPASGFKFWGPRAAPGASFPLEGYWVRNTVAGQNATVGLSVTVDLEAP
ncbi:MAG TPA: hypothetical protein VM286_05825 [Candidatus Thermoplasmatota archaeon]|nr:hypothetical protein [Candidatus Thermoplasmatota archaeon]